MIWWYTNANTYLVSHSHTHTQPARNLWILMLFAFVVFTFFTLRFLWTNPPDSFSLSFSLLTHSTKENRKRKRRRHKKKKIFAEIITFIRSVYVCCVNGAGDVVFWVALKIVYLASSPVAHIATPKCIVIISACTMCDNRIGYGYIICGRLRDYTKRRRRSERSTNLKHIDVAEEKNGICLKAADNA